MEPRGDGMYARAVGRAAGGWVNKQIAFNYKPQ